MTLNILVWGNTYGFDLSCRLRSGLARDINVLEAKSYLDAVHLLKKMGKDIDFILTFIDVNNFETLYRTQQMQKEHSNLPLLAIFDTGCEVKAIENIDKIITMLHTSEPGDPFVDSNKSNNVSYDDDNCSLTPRQTQVLKLIVGGKSNKQIARDLNISEGTIKIHCMAIYKEIGVLNRTQAAIKAESLVRRGVI